MQSSSGLPRGKRLIRSDQFGRVFADASRSSDRYFTVLSRRNDEAVARLGLTVSRRIAKHATVRNRLKRIAREVFRQEESLPPLDFVVLANRAAPAADNAQLMLSLRKHFRHLAASNR